MLWVRSICPELDTYLTNVNIFLIKKHVRSNYCRSKSCTDLWNFWKRHKAQSNDWSNAQSNAKSIFKSIDQSNAQSIAWGNAHRIVKSNVCNAPTIC